MAVDSQVETFHGGCPHDCPDTCAMTYTVKHGRLIEVEGKAEHPMTRGGLCVKLKDFQDHHYNADRVLFPLKRHGPKGSRAFVRITWDEALAEIRQRWTDIIQTHGAQAILPLSYLGNEGLIQGLTAGDAFFNKLGTTVCEKTYCASGSSTAWFLTHGPVTGVDPESFSQSKYVIIWGCNTLSTNLHHWHFVREAQEKGAKLVVIDAYRSITAKKADWHIAPRPGTDGALALAMMNVLIAENLVDQAYVDAHVSGYPELKAHAAECTPEWAEKICGVAADDIRTLAREFAAAGAASIRIGVALERSAGGAQGIRAICALPALTGAWKYPAGGIYQAPFWEFPIKWDEVCRPDWIAPGTRVINLLRLGAALTGEIPLEPPIQSLFVYNTNPVTQAPETDKIIAGLKRGDLFTVVADHFVSDTAAYADIVLPATMAAEMDDMMWSWGHLYFTLNEKAIEAPGEAVSNSELFRRLAKAMGFTDPEFTRSDKEMIEKFIDWTAPQMEGIDMTYLRKHGFAHLKLGDPATRTPHRDGNFKTPSGKVEVVLKDAKNFVAPPFRHMYTEFQGGEPIPDLPSYIPPYENPDTAPEVAKTYPLNIVAPKSHGFLNSCYANEVKKIHGQGEQFIMINPTDAAARSIKHGNRVRVYNDNGAFLGVANVTGDVNPGIVVGTLGYWRTLNPVGTVNSIAAGRFGGMGHCPTFSDNLVEVESTN